MTNDSSGDDARPTRMGLAGRLRTLRSDTRPSVSQTAAAKAIGAAQNKLSRIEAGRHVPTPDEVRTLTQLYGATRAEQRQLMEWAKALAPGEVDARVILRRGGGTAAFQARIRQLEEGAELVRAFQPTMVLGQLQTEAYATVVFGGAGDAVRERMRRTRMLLEDTTRRWQLVQPVGALLWNMGGAAVMAEQMDALVAASRLSHVELRVISADQPVDYIATHGFHVYDHKAVVVGILTGTTIDQDQQAIGQYVGLFERLWASAIGGDQAREILTAVGDDYRRRI